MVPTVLSQFCPDPGFSIAFFSPLGPQNRPRSRPPIPARSSKSILFQRILIRNRWFSDPRPLPTRPGAQNRYFNMNPPTKNDDVCVGYNQVTGLRSSRTRSPRQGGAGCVLTSHSNSNCNDNNDNSNINGVRQWGVQNSSVGQTREHQSCLSSQLRHSRHQKEGRNKERQKNKTKKENKGEKEVSNSIYTNSRSTALRLLLVF